MKNEISIEEMMDMSNLLFEKNKERWTPKTPASNINFVCWLVAEIGEVIDIIKKKGTEKIMNDPDVRQEMIEEITDCYMYLADILNRYEYTSDEFSDVYRKKMSFNLNRDYTKGKTNKDKETDLYSTNNENKFVILEGADGVGKSSFQDIILAYYKHIGLEEKIIYDKQIKNEVLSPFITKLRIEPKDVSKYAIQHLGVSAIIDNFYKYILPAFQNEQSVILDRSWISTYVYSLHSGISEQETQIISNPIIKIWEIYKQVIPKPSLVIFERSNTLKPNELNHNDFERISNLYRSLPNSTFFKNFNIFYINNDNDLETTWSDLATKLKLSYIPLNQFYTK